MHKGNIYQFGDVTLATRPNASLPPLSSWPTPHTYLYKILFKFIVSSETPVFTLRLFSWPCLHPAPLWSMSPLPHPKWLDVSSKTPDMCIWNSHVSTEYFSVYKMQAMCSTPALTYS